MPPRRALSKAKPTTADDLAAQLADRLTIKEPTVTRKDQQPPLTKMSAMKAINDISQTLSQTVKSGWKASGSEPKKQTTTLAQVRTLVSRAERALDYLRNADGVVSLDVERAAASLVSKLVHLELHDLASKSLLETRARIVQLYPISQADEEPSILSLPLPIEPIHCKTLLTLISTHLTYAITAASFTHTTKALSALLFQQPTILEWAPLLSTALPSEHCNTILTRVYSTLVKQCGQSSGEDIDSSFRVRHYALMCLMQVSSLEADSYWGQVLKATSVYLKTKKDEVAAANGVHAVYTSIVGAAMPRRELFTGISFDKFCQTWVHIGQKTGSLSILDFIRRKLASICKTSENAAINPAQITAIMKQACVVLEQNDDQSDPNPLFNEAREALDLSLETLDPRDREVILKAALTLRRLCTLAVEHQTTRNSSPVRDLLLETITLIEKNLSTISLLRDACTQILDSLFVLSNADICVPGPTSPASAFQHIDRATKLVHTEVVRKGVTPGDRANYARCISSAAHNHGVKLYQQGAHSASIKFLEYACTLGEEGMQLRSMAVEDTKEDAKDQKRWQSLQESVYRRWELLGVCYSKAGDRSKMFDSFVRSVLSFPFEDSSIESETSKSPVPTIYAATPALQQLGVLVERVTMLGALDLGLEPPAVCLSTSSPNNLNSSAINGALWEKQIDCLDSSLWRDQSSLLVHLFSSLLEVYTPLSMPLRRARVLLRLLEFSFYVELPASNRYADYTAIAAEVESMCAAQKLGQDVGLQRFKPQFLCTKHLWLVLHTYKDTSQTQSLEEVAQHSIEETCMLLKIISHPASARAASPVAPVRDTKRKIPVRKVVATKTPSRTKAKAVKDTSDSNEISPLQPMIDPSLRFFALIESLSYLANLLGLALPNVHLLHASLKVCSREGLKEEHVVLSGMLADQLIRLGKHERAKGVLQKALASIKAVAVAEEASVPLYLLYAWVLAEEGAITESASTYREAMSLADNILPEEKNGPTNRRILHRVGALERAALAAQIFSCIQDHRSDPQQWLKGLQQSIRLWNRALDALSRLKNRPPAPQPAEADDNPFLSTAPAAAPPPDQEAATRVASLKISSHRMPIHGVEWRVTAATFRCLLHLADSYLRRGLPRESEFFSQQALDLADALYLPATVSAAWARKARVQLLQGLPEPCHISLENGQQTTSSVTGLESAELTYLQGELSRKTSEEEAEAGSLYDSATRVLLNLEESFNLLENARKSMLPAEVSSGAETLGADMLAAILSDSIWLLRRSASDQFSESLESFMRLPQRPRIKLIQDALMAKLTLHDVYQLLQSDMFLSSIPESTIALPLDISPGSSIKGSSSQEILQVLDTAEELFWNNLARSLPHGAVSRVRETILTLTLVKSLQCSLRKESTGLAAAAARLLDAGAVVSLRRDMVDAINSKLDNDHSSNDLSWPRIKDDGSPSALEEGPKVSNSTNLRGMLNFPNDHLQMEDDLEGTAGHAMRNHWEALRTKYSSFDTELLQLPALHTAHLPQTWTVVHINVSPDAETLFLSRQRGSDCTCGAQDLSKCSTQEEPLIFCIPLKNRRDQNEDEETQLSVDYVNGQLAELIRLSDENSRSGVGLRDGGEVEARRKWWRERAELDEKMKSLLENVEFCWFGAFKTIFNTEPNLDKEGLGTVRSLISKVFERGLRLRTQEKKRSRSRSPAKPTDDGHIFPLNDPLLRCFATLSPKCPNEELEDVIYFILDLYQHRGVPFAISEVDVDSMVVDMRAALEEVSSVLSACSPVIDRGQDHLFLVLGKDFQSIPWESVPALRGRSVSRVPSIDFLYDQLAYFAASKPNSANQPVRRIDARSTYYILNPGGDLKKTEARFRPWLKDMEAVGWTGVCGAVPTEHDMLMAMENKELVMYFGHGGGEQYVRSHKVKSLKKCASAMLWGCSSGALRDMGEFDRTGNPYSFMLAGCPLLVANLWDVTDGDIDRFSQSVFDKLGLTAKQLKKGKGDADSRSVAAAVAGSRNACKLKYLTGASPVVYGIPIYL